MKIAQYFKQVLVGASASVLLFSCEKAKEVELLGDTAQKYIKFLDYGGTGSGFANSNLSLDPANESEFIDVQVELVAQRVSSTDIKVVAEVDPAALEAYNAAQTRPQDKYQLLPDSVYTFTPITFTIPAGSAMSDIMQVEFHPDKLDGSINYMLPISIKSITGAPEGTIAGPSTGTAFFHFIGNPLAGNYQDWGIRLNYTGASAAWAGPDPALGLATAPGVPSVNPPAGGTQSNVYNYLSPFIAIDAYNIYGVMGNVPDPAGGSALYFVKASADYSSITYDFSSTFNAGYSNIQKYVRGYRAPAAGVKPAFRLITKYNNAAGGAGSDRLIDESYIHL